MQVVKKLLKRMKTQTIPRKPPTDTKLATCQIPHITDGLENWLNPTCRIIPMTLIAGFGYVSGSRIPPVARGLKRGDQFTERIHLSNKCHEQKRALVKNARVKKRACRTPRLADPRIRGPEKVTGLHILQFGQFSLVCPCRH